MYNRDSVQPNHLQDFLALGHRILLSSQMEKEEEDESDALRPPQGKLTCHFLTRARFCYLRCNS